MYILIIKTFMKTISGTVKYIIIYKHTYFYEMPSTYLINNSLSMHPEVID